MQSISNRGAYEQTEGGTKKTRGAQGDTLQMVEEGPHQISAKEFEVTFDGNNDPMNPKCMSTARKWLVVSLLSTSSTCVTCASSLYTSTYAQIEREFNCGRIVATLGLSIFVMGLGKLSSSRCGSVTKRYRTNARYRAQRPTAIKSLEYDGWFGCLTIALHSSSYQLSDNYFTLDNTIDTKTSVSSCWALSEIVLLTQLRIGIGPMLLAPVSLPNTQKYPFANNKVQP